MKSTVLLTIALFLISAPSPDSKTISEISAGFLLAPESPGLMAAENIADKHSEDSRKAPKAVQSTQTASKTSKTEVN